TNFESLQNLENGNLETIRSVDGQSYYSKDELTTALAQLIQHFEPQRIDTQAPSNLSQVHPDHSDHLTVGKFAQAAAQQYFDSGKTAKMSYYVGYPIQDSPENVSGQDLIDKSTAFFAYARHDNNVCPDVTSCAKGPYEQWLRRQYTHGF
ncbi:MAG: hypothetical protein ABJA64_00930, partial [Candidatus Saccharibacteria bacterium]